MGRTIDYAAARDLLQATFAQAESDASNGLLPPIPAEIVRATELLFASGTQAFREALVGCVLARILDPQIDIHLPYMNQGENAFNGRTLDEKVVNPFLGNKAIPCSTGPYLSALRRNIQFNDDTAKGIRDKPAYFAMLDLLREVAAFDSDRAAGYLRYLLMAFIGLRETSRISLSKVKRFRIEQYEALIVTLLQMPSGGLLPMLFAVSTFQTLQECFALPWEIEWQGINVADRASGVAGDISVRRDGELVLSVEVTEREIDRGRVVSTFNTKIAPLGLDDYLFFFCATPPTSEARATAQQYFAQGHDIHFVSVKDWIITTLTTIGPRCRTMFTENVIKLLSAQGVPAAVKVAWNDQVQKLSLGLSTV